MEAERRQKMKKGFWGFRAFGSMLTAMLLAAVPAGAQSVDDKIKALEQELSSLKSQQMELKKEATAAAAALPSFSYRPGNGMNIEAADKSWGIRFGMEAHIRTLFESGQDAIGRTNGEVMLRRWRPQFNYCIDNCLYEIEMSFDMDGFGTGNAKNSINNATSSIMQRGVVHFHLENLNPFLPTVDIGGDISTTVGGLSRQGSSAVGTQMDYDLLTRNYGPNTGRAGWGYVFNWDDRSLSGIGIPGRIGRYQFAVASINEGDDNLSSNTDRKDFSTYINIFPFSELKNKWIQGFMFEFGAWFCNIDQRASTAGSIVSNGCAQLQIRDNGDSARQVLFDTGANTIGEGLATLVTPGITWEIGPYRLRTMGAWMQAADGGFKGSPPPGSTSVTGKKRGKDWLIAHDLFLWSPKGFLTGTANTPGSILVGTHFERTDVSCDVPRCPTTINAGQFHRGTYIIREWDLWYFIAPRMSIGGSVLWYNASNLTTQVQKNLGIRNNPRRGAGGEWFDGNLNWRYQF
jgi:hypothetical protein